MGSLAASEIEAFLLGVNNVIVGLGSLAMSLSMFMIHTRLP